MSSISKILITGATGLIGGALTRQLAEKYTVVAPVRRRSRDIPPSVDQYVTGDYSQTIEWRSLLDNVDAIVHCAARVHVMNDKAVDPLAAFRSVNVDATLALAQAALDAGVKRFVFVSSIKVNGEATEIGQPFRSDDRANPQDPYGQSKWEAEQRLRALTDHTSMELVIIRLPMVYGPKAKGNFAALAKLIRAGIPLPLGNTDNRRSFIYLGNAVDVLERAMVHPAVGGLTFLVSDDDDVSTTELLRKMARAMGKPSRLLPIPVKMLSLAAAMVNKSNISQRLLGSLQLDIRPTKEALDWQPSTDLETGLRYTFGEEFSG